MTVSFGSAMSFSAPQESTASFTEMYLRQVQQNVGSGNQTLAEQQISAVQERLRVGATIAPVAGPVLRTVDEYVSQVAAQVRAGDPSSAEQAMISTHEYAAEVARVAR